MKIKTLSLYVLTTLLLGGCASQQSGVVNTEGGRGDFYTTLHLTEKQAIEVALPDAHLVKGIIVSPTKEERAQIQSLIKRPLRQSRFRIFFGLNEKSELEDYAIIQEEIGKFKLFTFIVSVSASGKVNRAAVMVYREARGGEIAHRRYLQQYEGKKLSAPLNINRDIVNITGATMSVNSMNRGVKKILAALEVLYRKNPQQLADTIKTSHPLSFTEDEDVSSFPEVENRSSHTQVIQSRLVMGSLCRIEAFGSTQKNTQMAVNLAFEKIEEIDELISDYKATSELSQLSKSGSDWVKVSPLTYDFLNRSIDLSEKTDGAFDLTIGPLMDAWGIRSRQPRRVSERELNKLNSLIGFEKIEIQFDERRESYQARLLKKGMRLDPGAIGKGYAIDQAVEVLKSQGIDSALINFSGCIYAMGQPPGSTSGGWEVAVRDPIDPNQVDKAIVLRDASISTSASYNKGVELHGIKWHHIIDPKTRSPIAYRRGAVVVAPTATAADAWSTAASVLGSRAVEMLESKPIYKVWVKSENLEESSSTSWNLVSSGLH